jgi:hypothetical protein
MTTTSPEPIAQITEPGVTDVTELIIEDHILSPSAAAAAGGEGGTTKSTPDAKGGNFTMTTNSPEPIAQITEPGVTDVTELIIEDHILSPSAAAAAGGGGGGGTTKPKPDAKGWKPLTGKSTEKVKEGGCDIKRGGLLEMTNTHS